jgi:KTSC domain
MVDIPTPPDPEAMRRRLGKNWESRASKGEKVPPPLTPEELRLPPSGPYETPTRMSSSYDPQWSTLNSAAGSTTGTPFETAAGARATTGGGFYGDDPYANMLSAGTFSAVGFEDPWGREEESTVGGFYNEDAGMYLGFEGFYKNKGTSYRFDPRGTTGGEDANDDDVLVTINPTLDKSPAELTEIPTSSIFPARPRTVAAGYDSSVGKLTVMFRDGTLYNYYGVDRRTWQSFVNARSKGRFIKRNLDGRIRGPAEVGSVPLAHRELMYKVARTTQIIQKGYTGKQSQTRAARKQERVAESTLRRARTDFKRRYMEKIDRGIVPAPTYAKAPKAKKMPSTMRVGTVGPKGGIKWKNVPATPKPPKFEENKVVYWSPPES